jgi:hypothetical protein
MGAPSRATGGRVGGGGEAGRCCCCGRVTSSARDDVMKPLGRADSASAATGGTAETTGAGASTAAAGATYSTTGVGAGASATSTIGATGATTSTSGSAVTAGATGASTTGAAATTSTTGASATTTSSTLLPAAFLVTFFAFSGSGGCTSRMRPSRSALRRTRSACASSIEDECVLMPIPNEIHRSTASLFVRPSSLPSSWTLIFAATCG